MITERKIILEKKVRLVCKLLKHGYIPPNPEVRGLEHGAEYLLLKDEPDKIYINYEKEWVVIVINYSNIEVTKPRYFVIDKDKVEMVNCIRLMSREWGYLEAISEYIRKSFKEYDITLNYR